MSEYTADMIELLTAEPETEPHIVIAKDKTVIVPDELKEINTQFEHNIETVTFDCPRYWDEHDLSTMHIYVNVRRPDKKEIPSLCSAPVVDAADATVIHFDWTLSKDVTYVKGTLDFVAVAKKADENGILQNRWGSRLNRDMEILEGIECETDEIVEESADIIEQILYRLETAAATASASAATAERAEKSAIAAAERANSVAASNPNLLDNWYFADPINQRDGYVIPPGIDYYATGDISTGDPVGITDKYYPVTFEATPYGNRAKLNIDGTLYYAWDQHAIRGYTYADNYSIDRWKLFNGVATLKGNGVEVRAITSGADCGIYQQLEQYDTLKGKICTLSTIINGILYSSPITIGSETWIEVGNGIVFISADWANAYIRKSDEKTVMDMQAIKLELGSVQTLAHQDANGNLVLNDPPPDKGMEMMKCQRYQVPLWENIVAYRALGFARISDTSKKTAEMIVPIPVTLRANPTLVIGSAAFQMYASETDYAGVTSIAVSDIAPGFVRLLIVAEKELTGGSMYVLRKTTDDLVLLDANL